MIFRIVLLVLLISFGATNVTAAESESGPLSMSQYRNLLERIGTSGIVRSCAPGKKTTAALSLYLKMTKRTHFRRNGYTTSTYPDFTCRSGPLRS